MEVVVFTASHSCYAEPVIRKIDPEGIIKHKFFRDHCVSTNEGIYIKDLRIFEDRNLKDVILIDNSNYSFIFQQENGIPIISFYDDKSDDELLVLKEFLLYLNGEEDVRPRISDIFQSSSLFRITDVEDVKALYTEKFNDLKSRMNKK